MGDAGGMSVDTDRRSIDRRSMLKGAAAVGVGVAAWSAPSITSMGGTPVYAGACTGGKTTTKIGGRNTNCSCGNNPKSVGYFAPETSACAGTKVSTVVFSNGPGCVEVSNSFVCPAGTKQGDNAGFCLTLAKGLFGQVVAYIYLGNCGTSTVVGTGNPRLLAKITTCTVVGSVDALGNPVKKFTALPAQACGSDFESSNIFIRYELVTAVDAACLTQVPGCVTPV